MTILKYDNNILFPRRERPNHESSREASSPLPIFITVCTRNRVPALANARAHNVLRELWSDNSRWIVGPYVIMPEHCHLIVAEASSNETPLGMWIGWWKQRSSKEVGRNSLAWQRDYWDTAIRSQEMFAEKIAYMQNNPIKRGLAQFVGQWPFLGGLHGLSWNSG